MPSVDELAVAEWDALAGPDELYLSTPWMRMLEATAGTTMRYLLAWDDGELRGGLATARADRAAPWLSGRPDALLDRCRREGRAGAAELRDQIPGDPTDLLLPGLVCGGRHLGRNRIVAAEPDAVVHPLLDAAEALARDSGYRSVSFLYVDDTDTPLRSALAERGYQHFVSARYSWLSIPPDGYAGYLATLSGHRRSRVARDRRRLREAGVILGIEPMRADVLARLAELETNLLRRYGLTWEPDQSFAIFSRIAAEVGDDALLSTARINGLLTGFAVLVKRGSNWYAHRAGFDYEANGDLPVYFDVAFNHPIERAAEHGISAIHYGTGSDAAKAARGCVSRAQHAYVLRLDQASVTSVHVSMDRPAVHIERLDPDDEDGAAQLYQLLCAGHLVDDPDGEPPCPLDVVGSVRFPWPGTSQQDYLARVDGQVVGAVRVVRAIVSDAVRLEHLLVHPDWRRGGIGSKLLEAAWQAVPDKRALNVKSLLPPGEPAPDPAASGFAAAHQAAPISRLIHLRLDLPATEELRRATMAAAKERCRGFSLLHWGSAMPEHVLADVAELYRQIGAGTDLASCVAHIRGIEQMRAGRQRHGWVTGVRDDATGRIVAWTGLTMTFSVRHRATQGMTVVHNDYRGRGIGTLVKLANLFYATAYEPALSVVDTFNDQTNTGMIELNERLGFRRLGGVLNWRLERAD